MAKFCPNCGNEVDPDAKFCNYCGAELSKYQPKAPESSYSPAISQVSSQTQSQAYQQVQVTAPQGMQYVKYADFGERFVAFLVDIIIIGLIGGGISVMAGYGFPFLGPSFFINWLIGFVYFFGLEAGNHGQTLGKVLMKIRTVDENTLKPTDAGKYALNNLLKPSVFFILDLIIGLILNSNDPQGRNRYRLLQKASGTVVIKER